MQTSTKFVLVGLIALFGTGMVAGIYVQDYRRSVGEFPSVNNEHECRAKMTRSDFPKGTPECIGPIRTDIEYRVIGVVDGDTAHIDINGFDTTTRAPGLDTPETHQTGTEVQCFGPEAETEARRVLTGKHVKLDFDTGRHFEDKGRLLVYLRLPIDPCGGCVLPPDKTNFSLYMIENGFGHAYRYRGAKYKYMADFEAAEARAKLNKRGMHSDAAEKAHRGCAQESLRKNNTSR